MRNLRESTRERLSRDKGVFVYFEIDFYRRSNMVDTVDNVFSRVSVLPDRAIQRGSSASGS